ncbi:hypothetical protein DC365_22715 [Vibrio vulnificus]|uniref:hypothetical protein n=1 Tax=Vibrio vulnificus TaxID=672 RepID=UPI00071EDF81|nr:hypothetical protein [Vibrio vulnificus]ALM70683.1 hypothetical protein FORC9_1166 [Vibrio vulnificus]ANH63511.1 hypothetical protein FORC16_1628 [Vibrio vulnificus]EGQ8093326.1 hypothetical protein [Vibrio vulnificus]EHH0747188.1 hypothetical protein [Vibrio vulnificus]MBN8110366.1 hypothetical protein [Vibrio vulnificus]
MYKIIYLFVVLISIPSFAQTICIPNSTGYDVCANGEYIVSEIAPSLPMQVDNSMSFESIMAFETTVQFNLQLHFDKKYLVDFYAEHGHKLSDFEKSLPRSMSILCKEGNPIRAFIEHGGKVRYLYRFSDGEQFVSFEKTSCE